MSDAYLKTAAKQFSQAVQPYELEVNSVTYDSGDKIEVTVIGSPGLASKESYTFDITARNPQELAWGGDHETFQLRIDLTAGSSTSPEIKSAVLKALKDVNHRNWNNSGQDWQDATKDNVIVEQSKFVLDQFGVPSSSTTRSEDSNTTGNDPRGLVINPNTDWPKIEAKVSSNTDNMTTAELVETNSGDVVWTNSINLSAGDIFTIDAQLSKGTDYTILLSGSGSGPSGYTNGSFPYTGPDIDIVSGTTADPTQKNQDFAFVISEVGNITGTL